MDLPAKHFHEFPKTGLSKNAKGDNMNPLFPVRILLCVIMGGVSCLAQDASKPGRKADGSRLPEIRQRMAQGRPEMASEMLRRLPLMVALDTNRDGTISASEIDEASRSLKNLDRNGDGTLSAEELRPEFAAAGPSGPGSPDAGGPPTREMMSRMFQQRDADGNGKLSGDEIPERLRANADRVDENGDGGIDSAEMIKAMTRMSERFGVRDGQNGKDGSGVRPKRPPQE